MSNSDTGINKVIKDIARCGNLKGTSFRRDSDLLREVLRDVSKLEEPIKDLRNFNDSERRIKKAARECAMDISPCSRRSGSADNCCEHYPSKLKFKGAKPEDLF